jgi:hypothetical protein
MENEMLEDKQVTLSISSLRKINNETPTRILARHTKKRWNYLSLVAP